MVLFLVYVFGEFIQLKQTLGALAELAGLHVNSRSAAECMTPILAPSHHHRDDLDEKPNTPSIVLRNWQPRSPPGLHRSSSFPFPKIRNKGATYEKAYHIFLPACSYDYAHNCGGLR